MAQKISREDEHRIASGLQNAVDLIENGWKPNDALVKIARDGEFPPGWVRLAVQGLNTGRATAHRTSSSSLFEKAAQFPLADASVVLEALYPSRVKSAATEHRLTAVSSEYDRPPDWVREAVRTQSMEKAALAELPPLKSPPLPRDPDRLPNRAFAALRSLDRVKEAQRLELADLDARIAAGVDELSDYFRRPDAVVSWQTARENAVALWGKAAGAVFDLAAEGFPRMKEASYDRLRGRVDESVPPYRQVGECLRLAGLHVDKATEFAAYRREAEPAAEKLAAEFLPPAEPLPPRPWTRLKLADATTSSPLQNAAMGASPVAGVPTNAGATSPWSWSGMLQNAATAASPFAGIRLPSPAPATRLPATNAPPVSPSLGPPAKLNPLTSKLGGWGDSMGGMGFGIGQFALKKMDDEDSDKLKTDAMLAVSDPSHEARLRKVRAKAMLHDMMANDEYLSGEDPNKITDAYNEISQLAPRASESPMLMRALLRRFSAQGQVDPHDVDQLVGVEANLKKRDAPVTQTNLPKVMGPSMVEGAIRGGPPDVARP